MILGCMDNLQASRSWVPPFFSAHAQRSRESNAISMFSLTINFIWLISVCLFYSQHIPPQYQFQHPQTKQNPKKKIKSAAQPEHHFTLFVCLLFFHPICSQLFLFPFCCLTSRGEGEIIFSSFSLSPPFPLFLAQNRCFPRQCLSWQRQSFSGGKKILPRKFSFKLCSQFFFRFPRTLPVAPARAQD